MVGSRATSPFGMGRGVFGPAVCRVSLEVPCFPAVKCCSVRGVVGVDASSEPASYHRCLSVALHGNSPESRKRPRPRRRRCARHREYIMIQQQVTAQFCKCDRRAIKRARTEPQRPRRLGKSRRGYRVGKRLSPSDMEFYVSRHATATKCWVDTSHCMPKLREGAIAWLVVANWLS